MSNLSFLVSYYRILLKLFSRWSAAMQGSQRSLRAPRASWRALSVIFTSRTQVYKLSWRAEHFNISQKSQQLHTQGRDFERNNKDNKCTEQSSNSKSASKSPLVCEEQTCCLSHFYRKAKNHLLFSFPNTRIGVHWMRLYGFKQPKCCFRYTDQAELWKYLCRIFQTT